MKRNFYIAFVLLVLTVAASFLLSSIAHLNFAQAENSQTFVDENKFTGKKIKIENAVKSANVIVVGRISNLGLPEADAPGERYYNNAQIQVVDTLKGGVTGKLTFDFKVQVLPLADSEEVPAVGDEYLFLLKSKNELKAIKILPSSADNLAAVNRLVQSLNK